MIVSEAGPLIVLLKTGKLSLLKDLIRKNHYSEAVYKEITAKEQDKVVFDKLDWAEVRSIRSTKMSLLLEKLVDKGEAEAIILAKKLKTVLIADDAQARKYAKLLNVEVIGTLGLLKLAKSRGIIVSVKNAINDMLAEGYYVEDKLVSKILSDVGELQSRAWRQACWIRLSMLL